MKKALSLAAAFVSLAAYCPSAGAVTDLAGQWHLDEGSGATVADSSGHHNDGTILGGAQWTQGRFGSGLSFNGTTSWVRVSDNDSLEPAAVSVTAWVKASGSPGAYRYIVAKGATGCIAASYGLYSGPDGGLQFYVSSNRGTAYTRSPDASSGVWDGNWHMVVGTFDGAMVRLFVDGTEIGSGTPHNARLEYLLPDSNDFFIGDYPGCELHNFDGVIDEVNVWSRALSAAEVESAFEQASEVPVGGGASTGTPGQTGAPGTSTPGSPKSYPPAILRLTVSPSAFALDVVHGRRGPRRTAGATVSYIDSEPASSNFTVLARQVGIRTHGKCTPPPRRPSRRRAARCFYFKRIGTFTHADRAGRNSFRFTGLRGHRLSLGRYRLDVTPRAHGLTGRTISVRFTIVH